MCDAGWTGPECEVAVLGCKQARPPQHPTANLGPYHDSDLGPHASPHHHRRPNPTQGCSGNGRCEGGACTCFASWTAYLRHQVCPRGGARRAVLGAWLLQPARRVRVRRRLPGRRLQLLARLPRWVPRLARARCVRRQPGPVQVRGGLRGCQLWLAPVPARLLGPRHLRSRHGYLPVRRWLRRACRLRHERRHVLAACKAGQGECVAGVSSTQPAGAAPVRRLLTAPVPHLEQGAHEQPPGLLPPPRWRAAAASTARASAASACGGTTERLRSRVRACAPPTTRPSASAAPRASASASPAAAARTTARSSARTPATPPAAATPTAAATAAGHAGPAARRRYLSRSGMARATRARRHAARRGAGCRCRSSGTPRTAAPRPPPRSPWRPSSAAPSRAGARGGGGGALQRDHGGRGGRGGARWRRGGADGAVHLRGSVDGPRCQLGHARAAARARRVHARRAVQVLHRAGADCGTPLRGGVGRQARRVYGRFGADGTCKCRPG